MIDREIRPGRLCVIIAHNRQGNIGKVVEVVRWVEIGDVLEEINIFWNGSRALWQVTGNNLAFSKNGKEEIGEFAFCYSEELLPIDGFQEDEDVVQSTHKIEEGNVV